MASSKKDPGKDPSENADTGNGAEADSDAGNADRAAPVDEDSRRPSPTIDLKAEEVDETADADKPDGTGEQAESGDREDEADSGADERSSRAGAGRQHGEPPQRATRSDVRGFVTHLAAGLVGGVIGVVGAGIGLDKVPFSSIGGETRPQPEAAGGDALNTRLGELEARVATLGEAAQATGSVPDEKLAALEGRLAANEQGLAALKNLQDLPGAMTQRTGSLEASIKALDDSVGRNTKDLAARKDAVAAVTERLARLEATLKTLGETAAEGGDVTQQAAFESGISELEQRLGARIDAAESKIADTAADTGTSAALAAMRTQLADMEKAVAEARASAADAKPPGDVAVRLAALEKKVSGAAARPPQSAGRAALAVGFAGLTRAVERGEPFPRELEVVKKTAPPGLDLAPLEVHAETGAPTVAALRQSFPGFARAARDTAGAPQDDGTLVGQFFSRARSVVRIERLDAGNADGLPAVLAGMAAHLESGDVKAALGDSAKLPDAARAAMGPWLKQARARADLDMSVKRLSGHLAEMLARAGAPRSGN